jgi:hypothetical protein
MTLTNLGNPDLSALPPPEPNSAHAIPSAPPAWYAEPGTGRQRWWNGSAWGDYAPPAPLPPPAYPAVATQGTNGLAIASLVLGILWGYGLLSVLAIIFGAIGLKQTAQRNQGGRGMAIAGLVLGIVGATIALILIIAAASASNSYSGY